MTNWIVCKLDEICDIFTGNSINEKEKLEKYTNISMGYNYIGTKDVGFDQCIDYENGIKIPTNDLKFKIAPKGSVLLCIEGGSAGRKIGLTNQDVYFGNKLCAFVSKIDNKYIFYFLQTSDFRNIFSYNKNGLIGGVSVNKLKNIEIPLPPLAEQRRIVAKIEELFAGIDAGVENLKSVKNQIALYRQSVLKSAFEKTFKNVPLVEITSKIGSGSTPKGGKENYQQSGIPIIRSMNVLMNNFTEKGLAFLNDAQAKALNNVILKKNDVLLNITGTSIGRTCVLPEKYIGARVNQHVSIIRPKKEIDSFFLSYFLSSPKIQAKITLENYGATRQALTKSALEAFQIPVPTLAEQERIVAEIESRFERADALEAAVDRALNDAEKLKQAVLKKAFSGELVPQNPDDEPASVLLARIRAARASELPAKKGKRK